MVRRLREAAAIFAWAVGLYLLVALLSYSVYDPGWINGTDKLAPKNAGGITGAWIADLLLTLFGYFGFLWPGITIYLGVLFFKSAHPGSKMLSATTVAKTPPSNRAEWGLRGLGFVLTLAMADGLASSHFRRDLLLLPGQAGGLLGDVVGGLLNSIFSPIGGTLFMLALTLIGVTLLTGLSWVRLLEKVGGWTLIGLTRAWNSLFALLARLRQQRVSAQASATKKSIRAASDLAVKHGLGEAAQPKLASKLRIDPPVKTLEVSDRVAREKQVPLFDSPGEGALPPLALLDDPIVKGGGYSTETLEAMSRLVENKLRDFNVEVEVVAVHPGPVITRFELKPAAGVKVSQISNLSKDLARSLSTVSVRVVEVIPGKSVVGLEIPNEIRETVYLSEILRSRAYDDSHSPLTMALGKDISGQPVVADLARMPHLLVAGTTGSGKSVGVNAMLLSLLYKSTPEEVRLILVDPKMLELSIYDGIPHLLSPVVTDMKDAASALMWCVAEMERRYKLMSMVGVRNLAGYNKKVKDAIAAGEPIKDPLYRADQVIDPDQPPPTLTHLSHIVVVIDEWADLMMVVGKKVEELVARLAQKARAAGIHLILATQRPSVDVITGLIKANIPTRIAFQVSARVDSRTILDQQGAEQLLGHGDMLYLPPGTGYPQRVHGAFVADHEVQNVVNFLRQQGAPEYVDLFASSGDDAPGFSEGERSGERGGGGGESDVLFDDAVYFVTKSRRASISSVQRQLRVGYNRAARLVEEMERCGIVGALQPNGSREVLAPPPPED